MATTPTPAPAGEAEAAIDPAGSTGNGPTGRGRPTKSQHHHEDGPAPGAGEQPTAGELPAGKPPSDSAPAGAAVVPTRHREHRFPGRRRPVQVRFAAEEYAAIALAAGKAGLTPTGYVGAVALAAARGSVPPVPSQTQQGLTELMTARTQLRRFATNVNQAVAALNATGETPEWLAAAVETTARAVRRVDDAAEALMRRSR